MTAVAKLDAVGIVAADLGKALAFYRLLGLDIPTDADTQPHVEVASGGIRLLFDTEAVVASFHPAGVPAVGGGRLGLAFLVDSPTQVDEVFARVTAAGHDGPLPPFDAPWGQRYASVTDPDGNGVDLFAALGG